MNALGVTDVFILGGEGAVSPGIESDLKSAFGAGRVGRLAGSDRYSTGVAIAEFGVDQLGLSWDGVAVATGRNFPDALAGGVLPASNDSVMLLTDTSSLSGCVATVLSANSAEIVDVYYLGGLGALPQTVRDGVASQLQ
jgi:putative cell wall-binding protein